MIAYTEQTTDNFTALIDRWIDAGATYEKAYELANEGSEPEDFEPKELHELIPAPAASKAIETESDRLLLNQAMSRGFSQSEAATLVEKVRQMAAAGNYEKAYTMFISRLCE